MRRSPSPVTVVAASIGSVILIARLAGAQQPPAASPPPARYQPAPGSGEPPPPAYGQPPQSPSSPGPPLYYPASSANASLATTEPDVHAPKFSLWTGARLSYLGFGFSFYDNAQNQPETTGNFLGNGVAPQLDVGARLGYRYVPYLFWEHGFMAQGHRFAGSDASSSTDFYGIGFRYLSGDVDSVAFLSDISIGKRVVSVRDGSQTYSMSGLEFFRLGLGAEIRVQTLFTLAPLLSVSTGAFNDTDGSIAFTCAPSCRDGVQGPAYVNGQVIQNARSYVVLSLGLGIHFDVFGK